MACNKIEKYFFSYFLYDYPTMSTTSSEIAAAAALLALSSSPEISEAESTTTNHSTANRVPARRIASLPKVPKREVTEVRKRRTKIPANGKLKLCNSFVFTTIPSKYGLAEFEINVCLVVDGVEVEGNYPGKVRLWDDGYYPNGDTRVRYWLTGMQIVAKTFGTSKKLVGYHMNREGIVLCLISG